MKYIVITAFILSTITIVAMDENNEIETKKKINIKRLSQKGQPLNLEKPQDTPHKRPSPNTDDRIGKDAIPRRFSKPELDKEILEKLKQEMENLQLKKDDDSEEKDQI